MKNQMRLIGLSGKLQSGKDTVAGMIQDIMPDLWEVKKFAGKLKQTVSLLSGISVEELEDINIKNSFLGPEWDKESGEHMSVRKMLQLVGTEAMRDQIHKNVWCNALFADWRDDNFSLSYWLITDVRFPNEVDVIKQHGGIVIRINRPGQPDTGNHPSETSLDNYKDWNHVIDNDGDLLQLYEKVENLLQPMIYQRIK